jgi:hypothetical protein
VEEVEGSQEPPSTQEVQPVEVQVQFEAVTQVSLWKNWCQFWIDEKG